MRPGFSQATFRLPWAAPISDVSGDGLDDFVISGGSADGKRWLKAFAGTDASEIWATEDVAVNPLRLWANDSDVDGDGKRDLVVRAIRRHTDKPSSLMFALFSGASGKKLWVKRAQHGFTVGNADRRRGDEMLLHHSRRVNKNRRIALSFGVYDFKGKSLFRKAWGLPTRSEAGGWRAGVLDMGDLDADGVSDLRVELETKKGRRHRKRLAVLSGRSAKVLFRDELCGLWELLWTNEVMISTGCPQRRKAFTDPFAPSMG